MEAADGRARRRRLTSTATTALMSREGAPADAARPASGQPPYRGGVSGKALVGLVLAVALGSGWGQSGHGASHVVAPPCGATQAGSQVQVRAGAPTATNCQNHYLPVTAAFTVKLPAGSLSRQQVRQHVRAVLSVAD